MAKPAPNSASVFDAVDEKAEERALVEAEADVAAGRLVSYERVRRWLLSWGKPRELPPPECE